MLTLCRDPEAARAAMINSAIDDWGSTQKEPKVGVVSRNDDLCVVDTLVVPSFELITLDELASLSPKSCNSI